MPTSIFADIHGDKLAPAGGTRNVTLAAIDGNADGDTGDAADAPAVNDEDTYAGMTRSAAVTMRRTQVGSLGAHGRAR